MSRVFPLVCVVVVLAGNLFLPRRYTEEVALPAPPVRDRTDVLLSVLGESRTVMARYLWFKMDLLHEELQRQGYAAHQEVDVLPLLRMITLLDHSLVDAYDLISTDLHRGQSRSELALGLLNEGLAYNPNNSILLFRKARILFELKRHEEVWPVVDQALATGPTDPLMVRNLCRLGFHSSLSLGHKEKAESYLRLMFLVADGDVTAVVLWKQLYGDDSMPPQHILHPLR
ncbi:MAG: hypothetical protein AMXMBFR33_63770 [Candidatus Xenobia bacterium]